MKRSNVVRLKAVPQKMSADTLDCVYRLLKDAERGELIGLAYVGMYRDRAYVVVAGGQWRSNIALTRGMVLDLLDELAKLREPL